MRPLTNGPRSRIVTSAVRPFFRLVTSALLPSGSVRLAALSDSGCIGVPSAISRPMNLRA